MNDKKTQSSNPTTPIEKKKRRKSPNFDPECQFSWRMNVISDAQINNLADGLIKWVNVNKDAKTVTEYILSKGLRRTTFNALLDKHPILQDAHEVAMTLLGERLWANAVDKKADWRAVHWRLHNYTKAFKDDYVFHKEMSTKEEDRQGSGERFIVIEKMPDTAVVKPKDE